LVSIDVVYLPVMPNRDRRKERQKASRQQRFPNAGVGFRDLPDVSPVLAVLAAQRLSSETSAVNARNARCWNARRVQRRKQRMIHGPGEYFYYTIQRLSGSYAQALAELACDAHLF